MGVSRIALAASPLALMALALVTMEGAGDWLSSFAGREAGRLALIRAGVAIPSVSAAVVGAIFLFAAAGSANIRFAGWGAFGGGLTAAAVALIDGFVDTSLAQSWQFHTLDFEPAAVVGAVAALLSSGFALRVAMIGNAAFPKSAPKRVRGKRAIYGEAEWMKLSCAKSYFPEVAGIVIGEAYRVDEDGVAAIPFRADKPETWGAGGRSPLLCFDGSFGSSHGIVFAGSGGFKTTSVTVPTALKWGSTLVVLDPSNEVAPMVIDHRKAAGRDVRILDPKKPDAGFNALDWIGRYGRSKEEDIAAVASWIMSDSGRAIGVRDDFFRASGLQLLTALIADVCLSGHTRKEDQTLRQVRRNLAEPEPKLRERLQAIHANSSSGFVRENVAAFVNMTPETFSGVYANAVKETHWLSYENYAGLVSSKSFSTEQLLAGSLDVFINIDLKTLETHSGLARVIIGSFVNAIYNRNRSGDDLALFLLDEVARLGYLRILETARDTGRKYGISLTLIFQSIGQMRETFGGRDATSKWFESASWVSFAAINDPETAEYVSRRCGMTTVEVDQVSRSFQSRGSSRTRSKQLAARPLIQPDEVLRMRADEQIVFTAGNAPLRCGRAIWFRRNDMRGCVKGSRFHAPSEPV